ncbi:MAG: hypothetical protein JNL60_07365 [Bacteroidia bacterium]|nr:hypothetical protein [Bacteroidia bacterium]
MKRQSTEKKKPVKAAVKKIGAKVAGAVKRKSMKLKATAKKIKNEPETDTWSNAYIPISKY